MRLKFQTYSIAWSDGISQLIWGAEAQRKLCFILNFRNAERDFSECSALDFEGGFFHGVFNVLHQNPRSSLQ
jgi:hypothetical protein